MGTRTLLTVLTFSVLSVLQVKCVCRIKDGPRDRFVAVFQNIGNKIHQMPATKILTLETDSIVYLLCPGGFG